ncbi:uncharacterized protein AB9W97_007367 isoform 3-T4 [Spinachia spinachia]
MPVKHFESVDNLGLQSRPRRHYRDESTPREENRQRDWRFWRFLQTGEASRWLSSLYSAMVRDSREAQVEPTATPQIVTWEPHGTRTGLY